MSIHDLSGWQHNHAFDPGNRAGERRTWIVVAITAMTMVAEIVGGLVTGSMALLADGWHMATHVVALSVSGMAYVLARRWSGDERFAFGTWKIEVLGSFTSALLLALVAIAMAWESAQRLLEPRPIDYVPALAVAVVGLVVNLVCAWALHGPQHAHAGHGAHDHSQGHDHAHAHDHGSRAPADLNLRAAYVHVLTDALTSVLAIVALAAGYLAGWGWVDAAMGVLGAALVGWWSKGLLGASARILLDREMDAPVVEQLRAAVQSDGDAEICDLHVWRVGRTSYAAVVGLVAHDPLTPEAYRARVASIPSLVHVSFEVNRCAHRDCP
ncbi:MAG TPA: CDF family Co(II)/Ni(II) efflux transporter DmeF [Usitatibacter sp.]|nr:CDF family Co(II)/Ni(II) efflux transporter DmeF [Usitatibacter sp.]